MLAMCSIDRALERTDNGWGQNFTLLLNAYHLIGAYFLTTESDKHMPLLTRLYCIHCLCCSVVLVMCYSSGCCINEQETEQYKFNMEYSISGTQNSRENSIMFNGQETEQQV